MQTLCRGRRSPSESQASFARTVGERLHAAVVQVAAAVEHDRLDLRLLRVLREQLADLGRLLLLRAVHHEPRTLRGPFDLPAHAPVAPQPAFTDGERAHARLPTFRLTYSPW